MDPRFPPPAPSSCFGGGGGGGFPVWGHHRRAHSETFIRLPNADLLLDPDDDFGFSDIDCFPSFSDDSAGGNICHYLAIHPDVVGVQQEEAHRAPPPLKGAVLIHPWFWGSEAVGEDNPDPAARAMDDPRMNPMAPDAPGLHTLACDRVLVCAAEGDFLRWRGRGQGRRRMRSSSSAY